MTLVLGLLSLHLQGSTFLPFFLWKSGELDMSHSLATPPQILILVGEIYKFCHLNTEDKGRGEERQQD